MSHEGLRARLGGGSVAVLYLNFGPYHLARLRTIAAALRPLDCRLIGIELAATEQRYQWRVDRSDEPFEWVSLFHDRPVESITSREQSRAVRAVLSERRPAAIAIAGWSHEFLRAAIAWGRRRSIVVICGDTAANTREIASRRLSRRWWLELAKRWLLRGVRAAHVASDPSREYMASLGVPRENIFLKYDVVDNEYFAHIAGETRADAAAWRAKLDLPAQYFIYGSRVLPHKNQLGLVRAYARYLENAGPDAWSLLLVGSGRAEADVDAAIAEVRSTKLTRRPFAQREEIARCYALASALVFPSFTETWGLILNEAAAAGLPLLASNACIGADYLIRPGENGFRFDAESEESICAALLRLSATSETERLRMGEASRRIVAEWSVEAHAAELLHAIHAASA